MKKIHFNLDSTKNYADVQQQIVAELCNYLPDAEHTSTEKNAYLDEAVNVSLFVRQKADVYIGHNLADKKYLWSKGDEGECALNEFSVVFVPGFWLKNRLERSKLIHLKPEQIIAVGSPRVDMLRRLQQQISPKPQGSKKTILWAPLHDQWLNDNNEILSSYPAFEAYLKQLAEKYEVITLPHPRNREDKQAITNDLVHADLVISDYSSVVYEAWALGKPVIFPRWLLGDKVLEKAPSSAEAHIFRNNIGYHPHSFEDLEALLTQNLSIGDDVHEFMDSYLDNYRMGNASKKIAEHLIFIADEEARAKRVVIKAEADQLIADRNWLKAEEAYRQLIALSLGNADYFNQLAHILRKQKKWYQEVEALKSATSIESHNADWWYRLGEAQEEMQWFQQAAISFTKAIEQKRTKIPANWYYRLGYCLDRQEQEIPARPEAAKQAYENAIKNDTKLNAKRYGIGVFHQARSYWQEAATSYLAHLRAKPLDSVLYFKAGMALERCSNWYDAGSLYKKALTLEPARASWHYRLGYVQELQGKLPDAAMAYQFAAETSSSHQAFWFYRLGFVLQNQSCYQEATEAYIRTRTQEAVRSTHVSVDCALSSQNQDYLARFDRPALIIQALTDYLELHPADPQHWFELGLAYESAQKWESAVEAYNKALANSLIPYPEWNYRLGYALSRLEKFSQACDAFSKMDFFEGDTTFETVLYGADLTSLSDESVLLRKNAAKELKQHKGWNKLSELLRIELALKKPEAYKAPQVAQFILALTMADQLDEVESFLDTIPTQFLSHPAVCHQLHRFLVKQVRLRWWMNYEYEDSSSYGEQLTPAEWLDVSERLKGYREGASLAAVDGYALKRSEFNVLMIAIHSCYEKGGENDAELLQSRLADYFESIDIAWIQKLCSLTNQYRYTHSVTAKCEVNSLLEGMEFNSLSEYDWLTVEHLLSWCGLFTAALIARRNAVLCFIELAEDYPGIDKYKFKAKEFWVTKAIQGALEFEMYEKVDELLQRFSVEFCTNPSFNATVAYKQLVQDGKTEPLLKYYQSNQTPLDLEFTAAVREKKIALVGPAATEHLNGQEIDESDFVVRLNSPGIKDGVDATLYGSRIDIASFNSERLKALTVKKVQPYSQHEVKFVLHLNPPRYPYPWLVGKKNKARREKLVDYMFFGNPNHIPNLLFSLILSGPKAIKLFSMNFFLSEQAYAKEYRAGNSLAKIVWGDNLIAGFAFVRRMHRLGLVHVDKTCEPVINLSMVGYLDGMEKIYLPAGRPLD